MKGCCSVLVNRNSQDNASSKGGIHLGASRVNKRLCQDEGSFNKVRTPVVIDVWQTFKEMVGMVLPTWFWERGVRSTFTCFAGERNLPGVIYPLLALLAHSALPADTAHFARAESQMQTGIICPSLALLAHSVLPADTAHFTCTKSHTCHLPIARVAHSFSSLNCLNYLR